MKLRLEPSNRHRTFQALHIRNFRWYFVGQVWSVSGGNAQTVALAWLVLEVTGSGTMLGVVTAAQFLPLLVLAPVLGVVIDRSDKRRLLILTQLCALAIAAFLGALAATGRVAAWSLCALALLLGVVNAFDIPARQAFIREMVGAEVLPNAVALNNVLMGVARIAGPAVAGGVIAAAGIPACFVFNASTFGVMLLALMVIRSQEYPARDADPRRKARGTGLRYVLNTPEVLSGLALMALVGTFTYEFWVTLPLLTRDVFREGASGYAALMTIMSIGSVIGGLAIAGRRSIGRVELLVGTVAFGGTTVLVGLSPSIGVGLGAVLFMGAAYSIFVALSNSVLQLNTDPRFHGRVMALWSAAFMGSTAIGGPIMGWIGEHYGARDAMVIGGCVAIVAAAGVGRWLPSKHRDHAGYGGATTTV